MPAPLFSNEDSLAAAKTGEGKFCLRAGAIVTVFSLIILLSEGSFSFRPTGLFTPRNLIFRSKGGDEGNSDQRASYETTLDLEDVPSEFRAAFESAGERWSEAITGDLEDVVAEGFESSCTRLPAVIDDMFICAKVAPIDGSGLILGSAGPEYLRPEDDNGKRTPFTGFITIDSADAADLVEDGSFEGVILHEIGHTLGIGTVWGRNNLLGPDECSYKADTQASAAFQALSGCGATEEIPIEKGYGEGTACGHWAENCLQDELMTGLASGNLAMSSMTIASLADMGYEVDSNAADPFPKSQLSSTCTCNRRGLRSATSVLKEPRALGDEESDEDLKNAMLYGRALLRENKRVHEENPNDEKIPQGSEYEYVGDQVVVVLYKGKKDGKIHDVFVRAE